MELLNENNALAYLTEKGIVGLGEDVEIIELSGGVSNTVLSITTSNQALVLKQALPELKVAEKWEADQRRSNVEAAGLQLFHSLNSSQVPKLVFLDSESFVLIMERVPLESTLWKTDLLNGNYSTEVSKSLGKTLATWHKFGIENPENQKKFHENTLFEQLRIDPFYRFVANRNLSLQEKIGELIEELEGNRTTIVHGDFSPKNIMVSQEHKTHILDFEVMHVGNPVFDLAFLLAHLLCKTFRAETVSDKASLASLAENFVIEYAGIQPIPQSLAFHASLIALARVEGKSPVNYLSIHQQKELVTFTKNVLNRNKSMDVLDLFELIST